jgi:hypothetical protein
VHKGVNIVGRDTSYTGNQRKWAKTMVCRNDERYVAIRWDDETIYGFVADPTKHQRQLIDAINKLPITCRKIVILFAFEGLQRQEIAEILATSLSTVRFLIHRSGLLLQEYLAPPVKTRVCLKNLKLKGMFPDWPYTEYAELVELRKNMVFFD